jgi:hypothetical protein
MVIDNLYYLGIADFRPYKTDTILIVDSNAVQPIPIAPKQFESVARRDFQVL